MTTTGDAKKSIEILQVLRDYGKIKIRKTIHAPNTINNQPK